MIQYYSRFFTLAFLLILFQVLVFDNVDLFGFSDPAIYLVILITYRLTLDQFGFIFLGFATGFLLDLLTHTAGAHTIACLSIAFMRPLISRFALGANYDQPNAMFTGTLWTNRMLYLFIMIIIHQFIFTLVAYFSLAHFDVIFKQTLTNTFISFILIAAILNLLQPRR
ncbi:MAG: hypothetical protein ACPG7X_05170 [Flavobacteriaceae bacterium]